MRPWDHQLASKLSSPNEPGLLKHLFVFFWNQRRGWVKTIRFGSKFREK